MSLLKLLLRAVGHIDWREVAASLLRAFWREIAKLLGTAAKAAERQAYPARTVALVHDGGVTVSPSTYQAMSQMAKTSEPWPGAQMFGIPVHVDSTLGLDEFRIRRGRS